MSTQPPFAVTGEIWRCRICDTPFPTDAATEEHVRTAHGLSPVKARRNVYRPAGQSVLRPSAPAASPAAGWYPNPDGAGQRYWDGSAWTAHYADAAGQVIVGVPPPPPQVQPTQVGTAFVLAFLLPVVGLIWGIVWIARGFVVPGMGLIATSIVGAVVWWTLIAAVGFLTVFSS